MHYRLLSFIISRAASFNCHTFVPKLIQNGKAPTHSPPEERFHPWWSVHILDSFLFDAGNFTLGYPELVLKGFPIGEFDSKSAMMIQFSYELVRMRWKTH
ncbi:hypothetical protein Droror1_Dr00023035 [Drosera rotundifolia]